MITKILLPQTAAHFVLKWGFEVNPVSNSCYAYYALKKNVKIHPDLGTPKRWGDRTSDRACQVGGFSTIRVFYIACKRSCWWVKLWIFFLKARLSCQTNASVSKNEKWSGLWTIANTGESWFGCRWDDRQIYLSTAILANFSTNDSPGEALW